MFCVLEKNAVNPRSFLSILDFGCGCGRVIRHWRPFVQNLKIQGCDCNPELIAWCQENLGFAQFSVNGIVPPTGYAEAAFAFVYALSVFTHLPESMQGLWFKEMARITMTSGYFLFTTHGERYVKNLSQEQQKRFRRGEIVTANAAQVGRNTCFACHPEPAVRRLVQDDFEVVDFIASGAVGIPFLDVYLCRKK